MLVINSSVSEGKRGICFVHRCLERGEKRGKHVESSWREVKARRERSSVCERPHKSLGRKELQGPGNIRKQVEPPSSPPHWLWTPGKIDTLDPPVPPAECTGELQSSRGEDDSRKSVTLKTRQPARSPPGPEERPRKKARVEEPKWLVFVLIGYEEASDSPPEITEEDLKGGLSPSNSGINGNVTTSVSMGWWNLQYLEYIQSCISKMAMIMV